MSLRKIVYNMNMQKDQCLILLHHDIAFWIKITKLHKIIKVYTFENQYLNISNKNYRIITIKKRNFFVLLNQLKRHI